MGVHRNARTTLLGRAVAVRRIEVEGFCRWAGDGHERAKATSALHGSLGGAAPTSVRQEAFRLFHGAARDAGRRGWPSHAPSLTRAAGQVGMIAPAATGPIRFSLPRHPRGGE